MFRTDAQGISLNVFHANGSVDKPPGIFAQQWTVTRNNVAQLGTIGHGLSFPVTSVVKEKCTVWLSALVVCKVIEHFSQLLVSRIGYQTDLKTE